MKRENVYVIGAGFSAGLGYPLTSGLLIELWDQLNLEERKRLKKVIKFHHPQFNPSKKTSFPNVEQLLTDFAVNEEFFDASRTYEGNYKKGELQELRKILLFAIAQWFHKLYEKQTGSWLLDFGKLIQDQQAAIISFNWDLALDHLLFRESLTPESYGLAQKLGQGPILIKPHGSLNWYDSNQISKVKSTKRIIIFRDTESKEQIDAFLYPRLIKSKVGQRYTPLIIPPTYLKKFKRPIFRQLWRLSTELLSTPQKLHFLGYSLPISDLHVQFILRCGFHNQIEGQLKLGGGRETATGAANVFIVNPDQDAAKRIEAVAGPNFKCQWICKKVEDWVN